jgi:hypothetical protein
MGLHVPNATRSELECVALQNEDLFNALGREEGILKMTLEELREKITNWIIEGDEIFK